MELGAKLRQARQQAGLSQRQLCGDVITRNMLSQIENGSAHPSIATLRFLSHQLGLPISYFLEEDEEIANDPSCIEAAWKAFEAGAYEGALHYLGQYHPDAHQIREYSLLKSLSLLNLAQESLTRKREVYARQLLIEAEYLESIQPWLPELRERRIRLLARMGEVYREVELPDADELLYLRADAAMREGEVIRAAALLEAVSNQETADWNLLRGRAAMEGREYATAARCLQRAEAVFPIQTAPLLERCFWELGDYKTAYTYACKGRNG